MKKRREVFVLGALFAIAAVAGAVVGAAPLALLAPPTPFSNSAPAKPQKPNVSPGQTAGTKVTGLQIGLPFASVSVSSHPPGQNLNAVEQVDANSGAEREEGCSHNGTDEHNAEFSVTVKGAGGTALVAGPAFPSTVIASTKLVYQVRLFVDGDVTELSGGVVELDLPAAVVNGVGAASVEQKPTKLFQMKNIRAEEYKQEAKVKVEVLVEARLNIADGQGRKVKAGGKVHATVRNKGCDVP